MVFLWFDFLSNFSAIKIVSENCKGMFISIDLIMHKKYMLYCTIWH